VTAGTAVEENAAARRREPGRVAFDRAERTFFASGVYDTEPGTIRAFRMYYSPLL